MERETYEWYDYAAQEFVTVRDAIRDYERHRWAAPISGDRTTLLGRNRGPRQITPTTEPTQAAPVGTAFLLPKGNQ